MTAEVSRWWTELVATVGDLVPLPLALLLLVSGAGLIGAGWYWWPRWWSRWPRWWSLPRLRWWPARSFPSLWGRPSPWGRPSLRGPNLWWRALARRWQRWRDRRRRQRVGTKNRPSAAARTAAPAGDPPGVDPPDGNGTDQRIAGSAGDELADLLAAQGRYAEAVRERLRGILREITEHGLAANQPGRTTTELTDAAARVVPGARPALVEADRLHADLWYGQRPAQAVHDRRMQELTKLLRHALASRDPRAGSPEVGQPDGTAATRW
ncbi:DUF4129 domain-containing protein [Solwaraspora sp. WMMB335]|uniref:DUF4129 domain-containing protein n=1 Tax=Solwaraspora sp. WMMB335 TaxID=3404118 RepID=UPI003B925FFE